MRGKEVVGRRRVLRAQQRATPGGRGKRGGGMGGGWAAGWEAAGWAAACLPAACRARPIALGHRVEHGHRAVQVPRARAVVAEHEVARPAAHGARVVVAVQGEAHTRESYAEQEQDPKACLGPWKLLSSGVGVRGLCGVTSRGRARSSLWRPRAAGRGRRGGRAWRTRPKRRRACPRPRRRTRCTARACTARAWRPAAPPA